MLDGHGSHCTYEFVDHCNQHQIIVFCLPPHAIHFLQSLDVVLFQPYKHYHGEAINQATCTGCPDFNKIEFLASLATIRKNTFKQHSILSGFRKTGLVPFNLEIAFARLREFGPPVPKTPSPIAEDASEEHSWPATPLTIRTLKKQRKKLKQLELPSNVQEQLKQFVKGSIAQATTGQLMADNLAKTKAAEVARAVRQGKTKKWTQKGGVVSAQTARRLIREQEDLALEQALEKEQRTQERAKKKQEREAEKTRRRLAKLADRLRKKEEKEEEAKPKKQAREEPKAQRQLEKEA